jgi:MFS family permease
MRYLTKPIVLLSFISLFTDIGSEMLYPVIPLYLKSIGFTVMFIGILEGIAESIAGLSKGYFGQLSDKIGKRTPFVKIGYTLSSISKPLMGLLPYPFWIFFARTMDRLGKGVRTSARDALLSDETIAENKGKVFGFHRSMDTLGAVIGPLIALAYLHFFPTRYQILFILSLIPGIVAVSLAMLLKEKKREKTTSQQKIGFFGFVSYLKNSHSRYKKIIFPLLVFALFNSSDFFLLLKLKEFNYSDATIILFYILFNLSYAVFSFPAGKIADRIGLKNVLAFGLLIFSAVYISINFAQTYFLHTFIFALYGLFAASTEGISRALITNIVSKDETATALGTYNAFSSIAILLASSITGTIWAKFGSTIALVLSGVVSLSIFLYFAFLKIEKNQ